MSDLELVPDPGTTANLEGATAPSKGGRKKGKASVAVVSEAPANGHLAMIEGLEGTVGRLTAANRALDALIRELVPAEEIVWVESRQGQRKPVLTRASYAKLFRGLCLTEAEEPQIEREELGRGEYLFECTTFVSTPWGTKAYGVGVAATDEIQATSRSGPIPMGRRVHDAKARAHTRAWERAIGNLIGLGALGDSEVEGSLDLSSADQPIQFIAAMAEKKGISARDLEEYCQARFGSSLIGLELRHIPTLKATLEGVLDVESFAKDLDYWKAMRKATTA